MHRKPMLFTDLLQAIASFQKTWIPAFLILIILLMTACGNAPETTNASDTANHQNDSLASQNPCEMITAAEVESIFGEAASADVEPSTAGPVRSCSFRNDGGGKFFLIQIGPESAIEVDSETDVGTVIPDLGEEAVFFSGSLRVRIGESVLQVITWHPQGRQDEALAMTQAIARLALERLP
jgi:hypothetical protein